MTFIQCSVTNSAINGRNSGHWKLVLEIQVAFLLGRPTLTASVAEVVPAVPAVPSGFATILGNVFRPMTQ